MSRTQSKTQTEDRKARTVSKTASLHEKAVQAVARGETHGYSPKPRKRRSAPAQHPVQVHRVAFDALPEWARPEVRKIIGSGRGYTHWEVRDAATVIVR